MTNVDLLHLMILRIVWKYKTISKHTSVDANKLRSSGFYPCAVISIEEGAELQIHL